VSETTVSRSYAEALFALGEKLNQHDSFSASLEGLDATLQSTPQLRAFLASPKIRADAKKQTLRTALGGRAHPVFLNFMMVLVDKRRQRLLQEITSEYRSLLDERLGRLNVQVTVARPVDAQTEKGIAEKLSKSLGKQVIPHISVNKDILGGIIVRFGDRVLDGSLRRRLMSMRRRLLDAGLPAQH
jgi:F-type H+-transporting ATPase subunit delta